MWNDDQCEDSEEELKDREEMVNMLLKLLKGQEKSWAKEVRRYEEWDAFQPSEKHKEFIVGRLKQSTGKLLRVIGYSPNCKMPAERNLAVAKLCLQGLLVPRNEELGYAYLCRAARQGHVWARYWQAACVIFGIGRRQDIMEGCTMLAELRKAVMGRSGGMQVVHEAVVALLHFLSFVLPVRDVDAQRMRWAQQKEVNKDVGKIMAEFEERERRRMWLSEQRHKKMYKKGASSPPSSKKKRKPKG